MIWAFIAGATIVVCELFMALPFVSRLNLLLSSSRKAMSLVRSEHISDEWKEKMVPFYALQIGKNSILLFLILIVAVSPFVLSTIIAGPKSELVNILLRIEVILGMTVLAVGYVALRRKLKHG